jgi:hypothetical protein
MGPSGKSHPEARSKEFRDSPRLGSRSRSQRKTGDRSSRRPQEATEVNADVAERVPRHAEPKRLRTLEALA